MESEKKIVPSVNAEQKNKEVKIKHPLDNDEKDDKNIKIIQVTKENESKIELSNVNEKKDQTNSSENITKEKTKEFPADSNKSPSISNTDKNKAQPQQKDLKDMTDKELAVHYKSLFLKSKKLLFHYEEEINQLKNNGSNLKNKLKEYESEEGMTCEVLFRLKYNDSTFFFFKNENRNYFINENILDEKFKQEINQNQKIKNFDYFKDIVTKDETINQIITQYDDKMKRLSRELENTEKRIQTLKDADKHLKDELKEMKFNCDNEIRKYDTTIKEIIESTSETITQMKNSLELDLSDDSLRDELINNIKDQINKIKPNNSDESSKWIIELKSYISKTLLTFLEIIYKHITQENNMSCQKIKWQQTLDQLVLSHEEELNINHRNIDNLKLTIHHLNNKIAILEQDRYNIAKQKDQTIDILNKELNRGVNINYLRNVIISYLTSNKDSIKEGLLPVIFTTLQFSESEMKRVNEALQLKKTEGVGIFNIFKN